MSYALRNTLILLFFLLLIYGGGYAYMKFFQEVEIEQLEERSERLNSELMESSQIAETVPMLREQYENATEVIENFDKTIFHTNNPDEIFRFLSLINEGTRVDFNYVFRDSTTADEYGIVNSEITGSGPYRNVVRFLNAVEYSEPVQKINEVTITPVGGVGNFQNVNFTFRLASHYDRQDVSSGRQGTPGISFRNNVSNHNPFFPLIRSVEPNEEGLPDVDQSRIVGLSGSVVYMLDQNGVMNSLRVNDRVYLGRLESINVQQGTVTFRLNRGGIIDVVTLEVQR
jgi:hypothetical protein